jgi:hypothetical protein
VNFRCVSRVRWVSDCGHFVIRRFTARGYGGIGYEVLKDGAILGKRWHLSEARQLATASEFSAVNA